MYSCISHVAMYARHLLRKTTNMCAQFEYKHQLKKINAVSVTCGKVPWPNGGADRPIDTRRRR